jgi:hypothetical protein
MTREDIIRMAHEAGLHIATDHDWMPIIALAYAQKFAELVAAAERERIKWDTIHSCHPECDKPVCVAIRKAVAEEREACIEAARTVGGDAGAEVEKLIRARGQG